MLRMAAFVFPGFQTLDFFGPVELLAGFRDEIELVTVAATAEPVVSRHGQRICVDKTLAESIDYDILFVPGGDAALNLADDAPTMDWIRAVSQRAQVVLAVCTGTVVLGQAGVLDGLRATTNKLDFVATTPLAPKVEWVTEARWVEDGKFFTSSGVSAGMDAALGVAQKLFGPDKARLMAEEIRIYLE
ncbi:Isonitrile hydratase [Nymphon striatum]|nr:Isonitrile hydratase [Nymphon striatum]